MHPTKFKTGEEFMNYVYHTWPSRDTHVEMQGAGHWLAFIDGDDTVSEAVYDERTKRVDWLDDSGEPITEGCEPMELLRELLQLDEAEKKKKKPKVSKKAVKAVYHRDYVKTKNKPYRKYDSEEYVQGKRD